MLIMKLIKYKINTNRLFVVIVVAVALVMMSATIRFIYATKQQATILKSKM
jgi:hypothetical protein